MSEHIRARKRDLDETELQQELEAAFQTLDAGGLEAWLPAEEQQFEVNKIVKGRVVNVTDGTVVVDVGYKREGMIDLQEWYDEGLDKIVPPKAGEEIQVLLDAVEDEMGSIVLSFRKAKRQKEWEDILAKHKEGDVVKGMVTRKIKGGLLVNIGVNVFLPASQVDIRRPPDIADYIGKEIECKILKIDEARRNIVVSRRKLLEDQREMMKKKLLSEIEPGQVRKGVVKNIAEFGAFVDLGGIDGLLHITDMSWGRINNPHEMVRIDEHLEVYILSVDKDKEKIALSLKHKSPSPWQEVEKKYPMASRHTCEVVNVMSYGAFVKLEPGIEGLVHISEMSWTKRINHPSELVAVGDQIEVQVLDINKEKQQISLGMKQVRPEPQQVKWHISTIEFGKTKYPLRGSLVASFTPGLEGKPGQAWVEGFDPYIVGVGTSVDAAFHDWCGRLHKSFQVLLAKRPFEMTLDEKRLWESMDRHIDVPGYRAATPIVLRQAGTVIRAQVMPQTVRWEDDVEEEIPPEIVPDEFAAFERNQRFEAIVSRSRNTYEIIKVHYVRPLAPLPEATGAGSEEFWNAAATSRAAPETTWQ